MPFGKVCKQDKTTDSLTVRDEVGLRMNIVIGIR